MRGTVAELMAVSAGIIVKGAKAKDPNGTVQREVVQDSKTGYNVYVHHNYSKVQGGFVALLMADEEYPARVAHQLLNKVAEEFIVKNPKKTWENATTPTTLPFPELATYIETWQDPNKADALTKIQKELDETKIVLHKTIESVLERGEKIDDLVAKSDTLSASSKLFYSQAKKQNSCCVVM